MAAILFSISSALHHGPHSEFAHGLQTLSNAVLLSKTAALDPDPKRQTIMLQQLLHFIILCADQAVVPGNTYDIPK